MLNKKGELMVGTSVKVLAAVVVGALLLVGTQAIVNETVLPNANEKIVELFDATPENHEHNNAEEGAETIYDNELITSKYGRRLFMINKNLIESKYGVSVEDEDVQWLINGTDGGRCLYYANENGDPIPNGTTVQAIIRVPKGSISDNPNCCEISVFFLE